MQTGFNLLLWTTHLDEALLPQCEALKAAGYDGVEIPVFEGDAKHYRKIGDQLSDLGLRRTAVGVVQSEDANPMGETVAQRQAGTDFLKWMIDCCEAAGVETLCGPFYQPLATFSGSGPTQTELEHLLASHKEAAEYAKKAGVILSVEPLNRFECYALNTMQQAADLVSAVGNDHYGFLFDTFHANIEENDIGAAIKQAGAAINHVHISENHRGAPGTGHINFAETFSALKAIGYDGWLVVEAFGQALPDLAAATRVWRPLFDSEEQVVEAGHRVMTQGWAAA